jgi:hypothetical protein
MKAGRLKTAVKAGKIENLNTKVRVEHRRMRMHRYVLAAAFAVLMSSSCFAAAEFYVAQDPKTKDCDIVQEKPDGVTSIMIGTSYTTRSDAKAAKKAATLVLSIWRLRAIRSQRSGNFCVSFFHVAFSPGSTVGVGAQRNCLVRR